MQHNEASQESQTGRALLALRELLLTGQFSPGEHLSELQLVSRLGVSRTPVRQALNRLAHEGLLEAARFNRFRVREFTMRDVWDAIELRGVLEGTAARLAAERLSNTGELDEIRELQTRMDAITHTTVDTFGLYMDLNEAFHAALIGLAKSAMLFRSIEHVKTLPFASPSALVFARSKLPRAAEMIIVGQEQHHAILDAVEHRQGTRAEALAREHALLSRRNLEMALTDERIRDCVPGASLILVGSDR
ncbi:MAG TPA: GntR family transcriptional regulator [Bryobacteraceae bacterium]|nr:GntR family transcriptional regulator [Bryobacteraceae bacterium]